MKMMSCSSDQTIHTQIHVHMHTHTQSLASIVNYVKELKYMNVKCINIVVSELGLSCNASNFVVKLT